MAHFFDLVERAEIEGDEETSGILFELTNYEIDGSVKDQYMLDWLVQSWWLNWGSYSVWKSFGCQSCTLGEPMVYHVGRKSTYGIWISAVSLKPCKIDT